MVVIVWERVRDQRALEVPDETTERAQQPTCRQWCLTFLCWPLMVLVFSTPTFLATVAQSIPGDNNSFGLSQTTLDLFSRGIGPLLALIGSVLVPQGAFLLTRSRNAQLATTLMFVAQFVILLLVPAVAAMLLGSDCYGMWVLMWEPCQSEANFDMGYSTKTSANSYGYKTSFTNHA